MPGGDSQVPTYGAFVCFQERRAGVAGGARCSSLGSCLVALMAEGEEVGQHRWQGGGQGAPCWAAVVSNSGMGDATSSAGDHWGVQEPEPEPETKLSFAQLARLPAQGCKLGLWL